MQLFVQMDDPFNSIVFFSILIVGMISKNPPKKLCVPHMWLTEGLKSKSEPFGFPKTKFCIFKPQSEWIPLKDNSQEGELC